MKKIILLFTIFSAVLYSNAQNVAINNDGTSAAASAMLDVKSTTKGFMMPRMTTAQRTAIVSPALGLLVFDTDTKTIWTYDGTIWKNLYTSGGLVLPFSQTINQAGAAFSITNAGTAIQAVSSNTSTAAVNGSNNNIGGIGVFGSSSAASGTGVIGQNMTGTGVFGNSSDGVGVKAVSANGLALQVNGNVKISGGNTNPSNGAVLTSDVNGNAVWKNNKVAFSVTGINNSYKTYPAHIYDVVHLTTEEFDYDNNYAVYSGSTPAFGNSVFVAPKTGLYHFDALIGLMSTNLSDDIFNVYLTIKIISVVNGAGVTLYGATTEFSSGMRSIKWMGEANISKDIRLQSGDIVELVIYNNSDYNYQLNSSVNTKPHFGCHLIFEE